MKAPQWCWYWMGQCAARAQCESQHWWQEGEMKVTPFSFLDNPIAAARDDERGGASVSPLPLSQDDWWEPTPTQKYYHQFASKIGVSCHVGRCDVVIIIFGGRLAALFSPFLYWWWRRCLLWPPVWWCTLHLHNVSVRREEKRKAGNRGEDKKREA